ncbi:3'-5' exonuclease [Nitrosophilus kaiyonis]|uniref:3'-5' exonuclease n=1 Tax=Nitrosophilus kaiyonis TaxID=2930200 RepID=UPI00248F90D9|nr:3'-5' exonuclease [Nitrosophilus kaiyonis]
MNNLEKIVKKLKKQNLKKDDFKNILLAIYGMFGDSELLYQTLKARGFPIEEEDNKVFLKTAKTLYKNQEFVIVDIETSGSKPHNSQIIEIGAIKYKNGKILDRFESFVHAKELPEYITKLTGITVEDLIYAPTQKEVLAKFKEFLGDSVFVAHNVKFDYNFISDKLNELGFEKLANRKLCTIDLARRTIVSEKYGLGFLNESLGINSLIHHRAYADALTALRVLEISFSNIPKYVKTTEDLIEFSKRGKKVTNEKKNIAEKSS